MDTESKVHRWAARSGLILGPLAWVINQQFTSELTFAKCESASLPVVLTSGLVCSVVAVAGLFFSWSARRSSPGDSTRSFTATLGALSAGVFLLVIIAGTAAGFLLPGCYQ
jgi:hypothetical protein